jgi:hypothetical protein
MTKAKRNRTALALAAVLLTTGASPSLAVPGDPPIVLGSPPDGAQVRLGSAITFEFSCPPYRGFPLAAPGQHDWNYYYVEVATQPTLDPDATLADANRIDLIGAYPTGAACQSRRAHVPQAPGIYYWQVQRVCSGQGTPCSPDNYSSVYSFTVLAPPPTPPEPTQCGQEARGVTRGAIMRRTHHSARSITMRCGRDGPAAYHCRTSWITPRFAWGGVMAVSADADSYYYGFRGYRASASCLARHSVRACARRVIW